MGPEERFWNPAHHILAPALNADFEHRHPEQETPTLLYLPLSTISSPSPSEGGDSMGEMTDQAPEARTHTLSCFCSMPDFPVFPGNTSSPYPTCLFLIKVLFPTQSLLCLGQFPPSLHISLFDLISAWKPAVF